MVFGAHSTPNHPQYEEFESQHPSSSDTHVFVQLIPPAPIKNNLNISTKQREMSGWSKQEGIEPVSGSSATLSGMIPKPPGLACIAWSYSKAIRERYMDFTNLQQKANAKQQHPTRAVHHRQFQW